MKKANLSNMSFNVPLLQSWADENNVYFVMVGVFFRAYTAPELDSWLSSSPSTLAPCTI